MGLGARAVGLARHGRRCRAFFWEPACWNLESGRQARTVLLGPRTDIAIRRRAGLILELPPPIHAWAHSCVPTLHSRLFSKSGRRPRSAGSEGCHLIWSVKKEGQRTGARRE